MQIIRTLSLVIAAAALAAAQDKVTVPLSSPSQPATVKVNLISGSITVTGGGSASQIVVEQGSGREGRPPRTQPPAPPGMHRLDTGGGGLDIEEDHNVVTISNGRNMNGGSVNIQVPTNVSLVLKSINGGHIEVSGVNGEIEVENINGPIALKNVSGSVIASSQNGSVVVSLDKVTQGKPMSFTTLNGKIDVTLPADTKAKLRLKTDNGSVYSDFDVKMEADSNKPVVEDSRSQNGKYLVRLDHNIYASINGGGPEYRFETLNGSIQIRKK